MANSVDPDQTAPIGAVCVCTGSTLFASILNLSVMLGNNLQQTTSADDIFRCIFLLGGLRVKADFQVLLTTFLFKTLTFIASLLKKSHLLKIFANSFDPDQADKFCDTQMVILKEIFENLI